MNEYKSGRRACNRAARSFKVTNVGDLTRKATAGKASYVKASGLSTEQLRASLEAWKKRSGVHAA